MDAKKFAWVYLIKNGYTGVKHSYYGSYNVEDTVMYDKYKSATWREERNTGPWYVVAKPEYVARIKEIGVNWEATNAPANDWEFEFAGTDADSSRVEYIKGTLVLNNGDTMNWIADAMEVSNVFEMMAMASQGQREFNEIFGE